ncbi:transcription-repair coupling factor [Mangrovivirga cuniculi]|uniref:Transcription-repair-coupling factor n=1 Tax=Mangrovivirga cuniculi TaxID=2715131 RepID=A0A4D7JJN1_9BACT|nr:transcription-repair coupling factor [Mangrovivirga cuniculi]QCK13660.1 transcription-repair coupling factor [Mangrovivirga cuniculi]
MKASSFLKLYRESSEVNAVAEAIKPNESLNIQLKGISGSLDAVIFSAVFMHNKQNHLLVLHDKEEAAYFHTDLKNFFPDKDILFFPTSYKRPYSFDETENANILRRAEVLNRMNHKSPSGEIIVTYPEALTEKVINKRSLLKNTWTASEGDSVDIETLSELLISYDFERADFVYEAGQFAVRGGIIDIFSFAHDLPFRIELFGDEIDSIRTFDPETQTSQDNVKTLNIIPNVQTRLLEETRQSILEFLPRNLKVWIKDVSQVLDTVDAYYKKATEDFDSVLKQSMGTKVVLDPKDLFEQKTSFLDHLNTYPVIEFGNRFYFDDALAINYESESQPSMNKNFTLLGDTLLDYQQKGYSNFVIAESQRQIERLHNIFDEIDPLIKFEDVTAGIRQGYIDKILQITCFTDHQIFERYHRFKVKDRHSKSKALTLRELYTLQPGDFVTHIDYGIGRFAGLEKVDVGGNEQEAIRLIYRDNDLLYVSIHSIHKISKYSGKEGTPPVVSKLGSQEWDNKKKRVKKKVIDIADDLIQLYAKRKATEGTAFNKDNYLQAELESSFIYQDTPDQAKATADVKSDMEEPHPMDRLVCGDVGFGKTEVAIRAAFKAVNDGKQVAILVPTTILAMQHYHTLSERLKEFPVVIDYINRFRTTKDIKQILKETEEGKVDILIGTHRIVNKDVKFKDIGLLVIDEEQKFGVKVKEKLKEFRVNVDVLTLTATPIPRTLHFSLMGARDLSIIQTPPPNRQPVTTELHTFNEDIIRDAVSYELRRGGQVFFVHNRVNDIESVANIVLKLVPDARIGIAHGQMQGHQLEKAMLRFIEGEYDVLVSTNIIEAGLDIPNANTIIINQAHMFGLSDLHQMRGRVGRSNKKAFCYLLTPPTIGLSTEARKRLSTLEEFSDLGDGFKVAMRDLDIRGAGNLLGSEQSGFITDLGFDTYHKILDEAIQELKEKKYKDLFEKELSEKVKNLVPDSNIETDMEILIPEDYVSNIAERLSLYNQADNLKTQEELDKFERNLRDRFGPLPESVKSLLETVELRWMAQQLGFEKVNLKNGAIKAFCPPSDREEYYNSAIFGSIIGFIQQNPRFCRMKETGKRLVLTIQDVESVSKAKEIMKQMMPQEVETS